MKNDAAREMKERLRSDLRAALRQRRADEARLLRTLVAAIDNAEAPPLEAGVSVDRHRFAARSAEIRRMVLSPEQVREVLIREVEERERAAAEMERLGRPDHAGVLRAEVMLAKRYLDPPVGTPGI